MSGISVTAKLVLAVGVSGAPQHWVGIKDCGSIVAVNTDAEAPLMRMADLPIQGDGLAFLKELGTLIASTLTDVQKEALQKASEARRARPARRPGAGQSAPTSATEPHEPLPDAPLKVDLRSLEFDAFHVYKVDRARSRLESREAAPPAPQGREVRRDVPQPRQADGRGDPLPVPSRRGERAAGRRSRRPG